MAERRKFVVQEPIVSHFVLKLAQLCLLPRRRSVVAHLNMPQSLKDADFPSDQYTSTAVRPTNVQWYTFSGFTFALL